MVKRIGVLCLGNKNWVGGLNYSITFARTIAKIGGYKVFVFYKDKSVQKELKNENNLELIFFSRNILFESFLKISSRLIGIELRILLFVKKFKLDFVYPYQFAQFLGSDNDKVGFWMFDFQHLKFPEFFPKKEIEKREKIIRKVIKNNIKLILSSNAMLEEFNSNYDYAKTFVYQFNPLLNEVNNPKFIHKVLAKFELKKNEYFIICNQFWVHKNFEILFKAIKAFLKTNHNTVYKFVFTGRLQDDRFPNNYDLLKNKYPAIFENEKVLFLGLIERQEQLILIQESLGLIQPSLYEGWNSSIEEAKCLNVPVVASDIKVHREQLKGDDNYIFDKSDPMDLITKLELLIGSELKSNSFSKNKMQKTLKEQIDSIINT